MYVVNDARRTFVVAGAEFRPGTPVFVNPCFLKLRDFARMMAQGAFKVFQAKANAERYALVSRRLSCDELLQKSDPKGIDKKTVAMWVAALKCGCMVSGVSHTPAFNFAKLILEKGTIEAPAEAPAEPAPVKEEVPAEPEKAETAEPVAEPVSETVAEPAVEETTEPAVEETVEPAEEAAAPVEETAEVATETVEAPAEEPTEAVAEPEEETVPEVPAEDEPVQEEVKSGKKKKSKK